MICTQLLLWNVYVIFSYLIRIFIMFFFGWGTACGRPCAKLLPRPWSAASNNNNKRRKKKRKNNTNLNMHNMATNRRLALLVLLFGLFLMPLNYLFKFQLCPAQWPRPQERIFDDCAMLCSTSRKVIQFSCKWMISFECKSQRYVQTFYSLLKKQQKENRNIYIFRIKTLKLEIHLNVVYLLLLFP